MKAKPTSITTSTTWVLFALTIVQSALALAAAPSISVHLQRPHVERSPAETLQHLSDQCTALGIDHLDVYGDFENDASFLNRFQAELAEELGMEDAVFMPSGVMAQSIALLIHHRGKSGTSSAAATFACHHTSHLLLHEQDAYRELLGMEPVVLSTVEQAQGISIPPLLFPNVQQILDGHMAHPSTLILELPHREIGGKMTPWNHVLLMKDYCQEHGMAFHLDGARIFEATTGYDKEYTLQEICAPFDSVYISFYKGLGGISGAMLLGSRDFCQQARVWLRRFGGNLYTVLPYAVSGWAGYRLQWKLQEGNDLSFSNKKDKLVRLVEQLTKNPQVSSVLAFDPAIPETNMVHGYLKATPEQCSTVLDQVEKDNNIRVLSRVRPVEKEEPAYALGYRSRFEWPMGEANGKIEDSIFLKGWKILAKGLMENVGEEEKESC